MNLHDVFLIGIDAGRSRTKVYYRSGETEHFDEFISCVGSARNLNNGRMLETGDSVLSVGEQSFFVGGIAKEEAIDAAQMMTKSKVHIDTKVLTLNAVARNIGERKQVFVVTACPVGTHTTTEKEGIKNLIVGDHSLKHNGKDASFKIVRCEVSAEAGSASWGIAVSELQYHVIDVGSTSYSVATFRGKNWIDKLSFSEYEGIETLKSYTPQTMSRLVASDFYRNIRKQYGPIFLIGGKANELQQSVSGYFRDVRVPDKPSFVTAKSLYEIGVELLKEKSPTKGAVSN